jgi:CBS domain containing-hemolysin-like protein
MVIFLLSVLAALGISFFCSLLEAVVLSFTPSQVADLSSRTPKLGAVWQHFKAHIERPIAIILILNTAAHTVGATIAGAKFKELYGDQGLVWFSLVFTYLMLQFAEILPKTLGVLYNRQLAPVIAYPLTVLIRLFSPVVFLIHLVNRPFERRRVPARPETTLEEITALAGLARLSNLIGAHQERIIRGASRLSGLRVHEVMIPVEQVTFLSTAQPLMDAIVAAHQDPHTRFPICEGDDRNRVLGYLNFKEMIYRARTNPNDPSLHGIIRPVHFVGPDEPAAELLKAFVDRHEHMAIVRGLDGTTLGLVALEDIVEELVGELEDEFDRVPRMLHPLSGGTWMVGGGLPVKELGAKIGLALPDAHGTTSAWLIRQFGRVPKPNEARHVGGAEFLVRRRRRGKVFEVSVTRATPPERPAGEPQTRDTPQ